MQLTDQQTGIVTRYLRDVALALDPDLPRAQCEAALSRLETLIDRQLAQFRKDRLENADVEAVLQRLGSPGDQAATLMAGPAAKPSASAARVWLGVCQGVGARFGVEPLPVRVLFLIFGLLTGPLAVLAYLIAYAEGRLLSRTLSAEPVAWPRVALRVGGMFLGLLALRWGAGYAVDAIRYGLERFANRPMPPLGSWGWLQYDGGDLFTLALFSAIPLALLSALPVPPGWDHTLKRCAQAVVALYGIALSFGIAGIIVGIVLDFVGEFTI
jgi:phage shock protein PspC (stress-responsive transcriptional regulator)